MAFRHLRTVARRLCELLVALLFGVSTAFLLMDQGFGLSEIRFLIVATIPATIVGGLLGFLAGWSLLRDRPRAGATPATAESLAEHFPANRPMTNIRLEHLIALNDEMAALARVGVPLERGLIQLGDELPGRLGAISTELGRRMESGESLSQIVSRTDNGFPPIYRAVVEAGIRGGRLSLALEGLSTSVRRVAEMRRIISGALFYPLVLIGFSYLMFVLLASYWMPWIADGYQEMVGGGGYWLEILAMFGRSSVYWWYIPPLLAAGLLARAWYRSGRYWGHASKNVWATRLPTISGMLKAARLAAFSETLRMLVEQNVPLGEAVVLSADASGDRGLMVSCQALADRIEHGDAVDTRQLKSCGFPPLLGWMLAVGNRRGELSRTLQHLAEVYRAQATRISNWLVACLPIVAAAGVGGTVVALLAVMVLGPWFRLLYELGQQL